jgi:hypothetical protein
VITALGKIWGRDAIYLDRISVNPVVLEGHIVGGLCSENPSAADWIPYRMSFQGEQFVSVLAIDLHDPSGYESSVDEVVDSELIARLRRSDVNDHLSKQEYHHWVVSTYDDIIEVVAQSFELELGTVVIRANMHIELADAVLRLPTNGDWPSILRVANEALPNAPDGNAGWLEARKRFAGQRRHYVAEGGGEIVAYGGIEEAGDGRWRLFTVMPADRLNDGLGDRMLDQLLHDARELGAATLLMREQADDALLPFVAARGFVATRRFVVRDGSSYDGVEVVELERPLTSDL